MFLSELIRPWFYFSYMEAKSLPPQEKLNAIATEREIETIFCDIISQGIEQGVFLSVNARLISSLIKAMMQDWYLKRRKYKDQEVQVEAFADQIRDLLHAYLAARENSDSVSAVSQRLTSSCSTT